MCVSANSRIYSLYLMFPCNQLQEVAVFVTWLVSLVLRLDHEHLQAEMTVNLPV